MLKVQTDWKNQSCKDRIMVALDCDKNRAYELANILKGEAKWLKVGLTLFYSCGPAIVKDFKDMGFNIFVDLKLHDIPHQVQGAAYSITQAGADLFTIHASGGFDMMQAAAGGALNAAQDFDCNIPDICAVTVLTSMNDEDLHSIGVERKASDQVKLLARLVREASLSGIICSPQEAKDMRNLLGEDALIVTPGVRPKNAELGDQSRVASPAQAFKAGASHIVVGRPITQNEDPLKAFKNIVEEIN